MQTFFRYTPFMEYFVYIVRCSDDTLYTGITTDLARRIDEHNTSAKGARYTRARRPVELVYSEPCGDKSTALKREHALKRLERAAKLLLIVGSKLPPSMPGPIGPVTS